MKYQVVVIRSTKRFSVYESESLQCASAMRDSWNVDHADTFNQASVVPVENPFDSIIVVTEMNLRDVRDALMLTHVNYGSVDPGLWPDLDRRINALNNRLRQLLIGEGGMETARLYRNRRNRKGPKPGEIRVDWNRL